MSSSVTPTPPVKDTSLAYKDILCPGSDFTVSLTKLTGLRIKDARGRLSEEFGKPVFVITSIELNDGTLLQVEGGQDLAYLSSDENEPASIRADSSRALSKERDTPEDPTSAHVAATSGLAIESALPFSLVTLQVAASKTLGMRPGRTQELACMLFKAGAITQPLTDCEHLYWRQSADIPFVLGCISGVLQDEVYTLLKKGATAKTSVFDDDNITGNHGIVPTVVAVEMTGEMLQLYILICRQYLRVLTP